jgi:hypothetical protein
MRIALFTPLSPEIGGGSVQLRSVLPELRDLDVQWFYAAEAPVAGERRQWLGRPLSSAQFISDLFARSGILPGSRATVRKLVERMSADLYWVVAHNEGISVAMELVAMGKRVHLTVHDDPICMFKRSRRYRLLIPLMEGYFTKLVKSVESVDVISNNLREVYQRRYDVESFVVYRYVPQLPRLVYVRRKKTLTIGHIGSVYHAEPFRRFLKACEMYAAEKGCALKVVRIGTSNELDLVARENPSIFENRGELDEEEAIPLLASCDFLYAMYPDGSRFECFRRTSLPMKLSTYIQAQRPIFAHTPADSGLAQVIAQFELGRVCSSNGAQEIRRALSELLNADIKPEKFEEARRDLMGSEQLERLRKALGSPCG